jgi:sarcosine oxidase subunit alpha
LLKGEDAHQAAQREALAVRTSAGLFESSPLGKIDVVGADAAVFLDRIYVQTVSTLPPERIRYGCMLNEYGVIVDDGVCVRLAQDHFLLSTTSGGANRIAAALEERLQCEWADLDVLVTNVTEQWGSVSISGPMARKVLIRAGTDIDLSPEAFPHMSARHGKIAGTATRVLRVSFTGECTYEIYIRASSTHRLLDTLADAGRGDNVVPYGVEATMILRTEKGYLHVGSDTDGTTLPDDVMLAGGVSTKVSDFVGRRSLYLPNALDKERLQLVGFHNLEADDALPVGAQIIDGQSTQSLGYVSSSCFSPILARGVSLGMLRNGRALMGQIVQLFAHRRHYRARVVAITSYDVEGKRLRG